MAAAGLAAAAEVWRRCSVSGGSRVAAAERWELRCRHGGDKDTDSNSDGGGTTNNQQSTKSGSSNGNGNDDNNDT
jgi:hypothetical protein